MPGFNEITPNALYRRVGTPDAPMILDLRIDADFDDDPALVPGSKRLGFRDIGVHTPALTGTHVVILCHAGRKISQGAAAQLRSRGVQAEVLEGGWLAWREAALPAIPATTHPAPRFGQHSTWVTRHRPKIDRIACPWLIRRFVDPDAEFLFVPREDVALVAEKFDGIAFDVDEAAFTHDGPMCSFDAMLSAFGLEGAAALDEVGRIVRAADTAALHDVPQAAGLLALSIGLSRIHRDDTAQLCAAMPLYDALFRWARDGQGERHEWPGMHVGAAQ